ncbi:hypothetical protein MHU86_1028 [Fragilaria crotonensis]|nr:hypothetical protein MHU86_1028 [Fragilaria crotonensis]
MLFTQSNVTEGRKQLATALINAKSPSHELIRDVLRKCFPLLFVTEDGNSSVPTINCTDDQDTVSSGPLQVDGAANDIKGTTNEDDEDNIALLVRDTKDLATLAADVFPSVSLTSCISKFPRDAVSRTMNIGWKTILGDGDLAPLQLMFDVCHPERETQEFSTKGPAVNAKVAGTVVFVQI